MRPPFAIVFDGYHEIASFSPFHEVIRDYLNVPPQEMIFCGMAIGYADESARLGKERTQLEEMRRAR